MPSHSSDLIVANLFAELHINLVESYARVLREEGELIVTGILKDKLEPVQQALETHFELAEPVRAAEWVLLKAKKR
jgi:ribosomal protein L11 methyltransferase